MTSGCGPSSEALYTGELPERVDFNFHVKPILSDRCFACHGPDAAAREADLRLDTPEGLRRVTDAGLLRPGELLRRVLSRDPLVVMPPPGSHLQLSGYEKAILARWIEQGAEYRPHWSLLPPRKPPLPTVTNAAWVRSPIDRFILARLEREGLEPSPEARKERLIRRVTYDLTGLPPTVAEVDAFLVDTSPRAYERVVDRLLASPAYGERMATDWLDLARYADSHGYQDDGLRHMWRWREWIIAAFNRNQPYDEFVTWQLAGDLLPGATREQVLATGFNRNHPQNTESGIVEEEYRVEYVADRTNTFGRAFLGLTMECARCHDHKYDPISQKEYYQLFAFFNNINEGGLSPNDDNGGPTLLVPDDSTRLEIERARRRTLEGERALREYESAVMRRTGDADGVAPPPPPNLELGLVGHFPLDRFSDGRTRNAGDPSRPGELAPGTEPFDGRYGGALQVVDAGGVRVDDAYAFERSDPFSLSVWVRAGKPLPQAPILGRQEAGITTARGYELALIDNRVTMSLVHSWPAEAIRVRTLAPVENGRWTHLAVSYDGSSRARGLTVYVDGKRAPVAVEADHLPRTAVFPGVPFVIGIRGGSADPSAFEGGSIDEVRVYDRALAPLEVAQLAGLSPFEKLRDLPPAQWSLDQRREVLRYRLYARDPEYAELQAALRESRAEENRLLSRVDDVMVMQELARPRPTFLLDRGAYDAPTERVRPATPASVLPFPDGLPENRLGLARWLFSSENPLTARVAVNRYWQMLFGTGLVKTSDDFGSQGEVPSHPELLDWLAVTYRESGWDTKALLRTIVLSATYRQSSRTTPELRNSDPENRLLARGPSHRLPAEMVRDGALAASGLLVRTIGGPSVKPYQPAGLWEEKSAARGRGGTAIYIQDHGEDLYRRALYTFWKRTSPPPMLITFDAAERNVCTVRRQSTSTPLQALNLLNDPQYVEAARLLAERMLKEGGATRAERLRFGFRAVTSRAPTDDEVRVLAELHERELGEFGKRPTAALRLLRVGEYPRDPSLEPAQVAAYTVVANTLLNLDEAVTKR